MVLAHPGGPPLIAQSYILTAPLIEAIRKQYRLRWEGIHGISHWARVRAIGLRLAECRAGRALRLRCGGQYNRRVVARVEH